MKTGSNTVYFAPSAEIIRRLDSCQFDLIYIDPPFYTAADFDNNEKNSFKSFKEYLEHVVFVIYSAKRLLRENGAILLRMDPLAPFNARLFLDRIFGKQNLRAEIIWELSGRRISSRVPRSNFDTVYFYSKSDRYTYHEPTVELSEEELRYNFRHKDDRGFFKYWELISPIDRPNFQFTWKDITPPKGSSWKYSLQRLEALFESGEIEFGIGKPKRKVYLTQDLMYKSQGFVWTGLTPFHPEDNVIDPKIQKIIMMASNPYDLVFDPFILPRSIRSIKSIDRKWAGIAAIDDQELYESLDHSVQTMPNKEVMRNSVIDSSELPKPISRTINAEAKAFDSSSPLFFSGQRYAVLIGINHYRDEIPKLNYCINDVNELEHVLSASAYSVRLLHDEQEDDELLPLRANIIAEIEGLAQNMNPEDTLFVHFSGHGMIINDKPVLITSDTRQKQLAKTSLALDDVISAMKSGSARKLVLSLDVCHAGIDIGRTILDQEFIDNVYNEAQGLAFLAASTARQTAAEPSELRHGLFTYFLLQGLNGDADDDDDGIVTVTDIKNFTLNAVQNWNLSHSQLQDPSFRFEGIGEIVLISPVPTIS